jgi:hypothetical protein
MKLEQRFWSADANWSTLNSDLDNNTPQIVFAFGGRATIEDKAHFDYLKNAYPQSKVLLCSTAGEILGTKVTDNSIAVTAVYFEKTNLEFSQTTISDPSQSKEKGKEVTSKLLGKGLVHVMVFSDGLKVNGTSLVEGILSELPKGIAVTGGLVGDGADFKKTLIGLDEVPTEGQIVLIGFYGDSIEIGHGSLGGWDSFGPTRLITKSDNHVLYELDNKPALELYKNYLGEEAKKLPGSGLLFPLNVKVKDDHGNETEVVRTLLAVDEEKQSMTFAGDMPVGAHANLMKANFDKLVDGAKGAAEMSNQTFVEGDPELAILISCIGRKLVLKERIEEETEAVKSQLGKDTKMAGFYSYGEISPVAPTEKQCKLHNQTMTITTFKEN